MSANALSAQGATLTIGTTGTAKTLPQSPKANPAVVTSTAHGLTDGTVVTIAAVTGMTEINGKVAVTRSTGANTFELVGVDSTSFTTYTSGRHRNPAAAKVGLWKKPGQVLTDGPATSTSPIWTRSPGVSRRSD